MTAYVIVDIEVTDPEQYEDAKKLTPATVKQFGGKYIARGGLTEKLEGDWQPKRLVILEFESIAKVKAWLNSPEYAPVKAIRHKYARTNMVVTESLEKPVF